MAASSIPYPLPPAVAAALAASPAASSVAVSMTPHASSAAASSVPTPAPAAVAAACAAEEMPRRRCRSDSDVILHAAALLAKPDHDDVVAAATLPGMDLVAWACGVPTASVLATPAADPFAAVPILPGAFLPQVDFHGAKTFAQLSSDELVSVVQQIGQDVLSATPPAVADPAALATYAYPAVDTAHHHHHHHPQLLRSASPPSVIRHSFEARLARRGAALPYPLPATAAASLFWENTSVPHTATGLSSTFGELLSLASPPANTYLHRSAPTSLNPSPELGATGVVAVGSGAPVSEVLSCEWFDCPQQGHTFASLTDLAAHLARHVPHRRSLYPCLWHGCPRGPAHPFPKRHKLIAHLRSHTHERPFECDACGRAFAREDSRDAHMRVHAEERQGPWGCACQGGRVWRSWRGVRRHQAGGTCAGVMRLCEMDASLAAAAQANGYADDADGPGAPAVWPTVQ